MNYSYVPNHDPTLALTRLLFWTFVCLFIAALLLASGALVIFEDGSFRLALAGLDLSGCVNPLALCSR